MKVLMVFSRISITVRFLTHVDRYVNQSAGVQGKKILI